MGARRFAPIVSVELPGVVTGFGLKVALVLDGRPEVLRIIELLPPTPLRLTVTVLLEPRPTVRDEDDNVIPKSGDTLTTLTVTVVLCVPLGPVPVIVSA